MFNGLKSLKRIRHLYMGLALIAVVGIGFALGSIPGADQPAPTRGIAAQPTEDSGSAVGQNLGETLAPSPKPVIKSDTVIHYEYTYELCGHIYDTYDKPGSDMIGLDEAGLAKKFPDATSVTIDNQGAHIKLTFDQICPQHVMLKLENGKCVVYRNVMGTAELKADQSFSIDEEKWDSTWLAKLKEGIIFESIQELESFVENMES